MMKSLICHTFIGFQRCTKIPINTDLLRYIDDVLSINNSDFDNDLGQMNPAEFKINDMTKSNTSASYLDLLMSIGRHS